MKIIKKNLLQGAKEAVGLAVIIDVFRAFSTACYLYDAGVKTIIPTDDINFAYNYKKNNDNVILIGERNALKIVDFDYGNSPSAIKDLDLSNKIAVLSTSSGTKGLVNATGADSIITASFVNARAIARYIKKINPETVSLVAMGTNGGVANIEEDVLLADYLESLLLEKQFDLSEVKPFLKRTSGKRFFDKSQAHSPLEDFTLCLDFDRFDFILQYKDKQLLKYKI